MGALSLPLLYSGLLDVTGSYGIGFVVCGVPALLVGGGGMLRGVARTHTLHDTIAAVADAADAAEGGFDVGIEGLVVGDAFGEVMTLEDAVGQHFAFVEQYRGAAWSIVAHGDLGATQVVARPALGLDEVEPSAVLARQ